MTKLLARRSVMLAMAAVLAFTTLPFATAMADEKAYRELAWDELIPEGVPYGMSTYDGSHSGGPAPLLPEFDENARQYVKELDGKDIKIPGYIIPITYSGRGVTGFILAPYMGACIHVPPPPPNQLIYVTLEEPYPSDKLFEAVWVSGKLSINTVVTGVGETGYSIAADKVDIYEWD